VRPARALLAALLAGALVAPPASGQEESGDDSGSEWNGFDLSNLSVPRELVVRGAPRDGIKAVDEPAFAPPEQSETVSALVVVLGVALDEEARGYPEHVLEWHQIVNDTLDGEPVAVTYDPLTGVPRAFRRRVVGADERILTFGVSGLLYNSSFLLYHRETESLWSQVLGRAVAGSLAGETLERIRVRREPTAAWASRHPKTTILERPFPKQIDYRYSPFSGYWVSDRIPYPVVAKDEDLHAKEYVLGVVVDGKARAYLGSAVTAAGGRLEDTFGGVPIQLLYNPDAAYFSWRIPEDVEVTEAYWFAWKAFHPDTDVWEPESTGDGDDGGS